MYKCNVDGLLEQVTARARAMARVNAKRKNSSALNFEGFRAALSTTS